MGCGRGLDAGPGRCRHRQDPVSERDPEMVAQVQASACCGESGFPAQAMMGRELPEQGRDS